MAIITWANVPGSGSVVGVTRLADGTILGVGTDNLLYTRATLTSQWVQVPNSGAVLAVTTLKDGTILGIGMDYHFYTRATLTSPWVSVPTSGSFISVTTLPDGRLLAVGTGKQLYTLATLTSPYVFVSDSVLMLGVTILQDGTILGVGADNQLYTRAMVNSPWVSVPNSGSVVAVTTLADGTILGVGTDHQLYTRLTDHQLISWSLVPGSGWVVGVTRLADGTIVGVGTDNQLYARATVTSQWVQVPGSGAVLAVTTLKDGTILGIGMDNHFYTRATLTSQWVSVPTSGNFIGVTALPDGSLLAVGTGRQLYTLATPTSPYVLVSDSVLLLGVTVLADSTILGVGADNQLYTRATVSSPWVKVPNSGSVIAATTLKDGTILGVGTDRQLYTRPTDHQLVPWSLLSGSGAVVGVTRLADGTIVGVGTDNQLYTRATVTSQWVQVPGSGAVLAVTTLKDGTILGIGMDNHFYTRATLNSQWVSVPTSGSFIGVTALPDGTFLAVGTGRQLYTLATLTSPFVFVSDSVLLLGVSLLQDGTILGIGADNQLYTRDTVSGPWVKIPGSGSVIAATTLKDGTILGVGTDHQLYTRPTDHLVNQWNYVPESGWVVGVTRLADGTILGVGTDNQLYRRATVTSQWVQVPSSGAVMAVTTLQDGSILGIGMDNHFYVRATLTSQWVSLPTSGNFISVATLPDGRLLAVGTGKQLYLLATPTSPYVFVSDSVLLLGVTVLKDGTILGVTTDNQLCARATLSSPWVKLPNSGPVIAVTTLKDGTILGVGKDLQLYTRTPDNQLPQSAPAAPPTQGTASGGLPQPTGDARVDSQLTALVSSGVPFSIFGVPFTMPIHFSGNVQTTLTADSADFIGTAHLDSPFSVDVARLEAKVSRGGDANQAYLRFDLPVSIANIIQQQVQPQVPGAAWTVINAILMPYLRAYDAPTVILAPIDSNDDQLGAINTGINFYKVFQLSDFEPFRSLNAALSVLHLEQRSVVLHVGIGRDNGATTWQADTSLILNQSLGTDVVVLKSLSLSIKPGLGSLEAGAQILLAIHVSSSETLNLTGGITLKKGDAGASLTIWGALDAADGTWHDPLGLKGLSIKGLGVELGGATVFPFIALGFRGDVFIGDALLHATLAFSFNPADLGSTVLQIASPEGINLVKLITSLLPASFLPKDIFDVALTDLNFYISPKGGSIAGKTYNKGAAIGGKLNLWGYHAAVDGMIDYTSGGYLQGALDRISISGAGLKFIELTDAAGPGSPTLRIDLTALKQGAHISGKLSLLGGFYSETVDVDVGSRGFLVKLSPNASGIYASAQVGFDGSTFSIAVSPGFRFGFSLFGQDLSVGVTATVAIRVSAAGFYQSIGFSYSAFGSDHSVGSVSWSAPLYSPDELKSLFSQFGDLVKKFFTDTLAGGLLTAVNWVKDNVVNDAKKVSSLFLAAGADSIQVAKGLVGSFGMSAEDAAKTVGNGMQDAARILKDGFGKSVSEVGAFMQNAYGASADAVNSALGGIGYAADQVNSFMHSAFSWFPHVDFPFVDSY